MEIKLLVAGIATGLAMSIPIGAVNLLIIRTALNRGFRAAALAALGAVLADAIMASIVVLGIRSIAGWIAAYAVPLQILGGLLFVVVGDRFDVLALHFEPSALLRLRRHTWRRDASAGGRAG
jgi:threonine/homoserine/homoserine lactone efflux protein